MDALTKWVLDHEIEFIADEYRKELAVEVGWALRGFLRTGRMHNEHPVQYLGMGCVVTGDYESVRVVVEGDELVSWWGERRGSVKVPMEIAANPERMQSLRAEIGQESFEEYADVLASVILAGFCAPEDRGVLAFAEERMRSASDSLLARTKEAEEADKEYAKLFSGGVQSAALPQDIA